METGEAPGESTSADCGLRRPEIRLGSLAVDVFLRRSGDPCFGVFLGSGGAQKLEELGVPYYPPTLAGYFAKPTPTCCCLAVVYCESSLW